MILYTTPLRLLGFSLLLVSLTGAATTQPSAAPAEPIEWSPAVNGLRGRLVITDFNNQGKPSEVRTDGDRTFCVYMEIQNVTYSNKKVPLSIPYDDNNKEYGMVLTDREGNLVARRKDVFIGYDAMVNVRWVEIPVDSTLRLPVTSGSFEVLKPSGALTVSLSMDRPWVLSWDEPQKYYLGCVFKSAEARKLAKEIKQPLVDSYETWEGTLELPRVPIPVRKR